MDDRGLLRVGLCGALVAALCCFTPLLVLLLGAVGLSAVAGWLDFVLLPALLVFVGISAGVLIRRYRRDEGGPSASAEVHEPHE